MSIPNRDAVIEALIAWSDAVDRGSLDEDGVDYVGEIARQVWHAENRGMPFPPQRFANCRGKLHGPTAVDRVLDSPPLLRMLLDAVPATELERELRRRALVRENAEKDRRAERAAWFTRAIAALRGRP